MHRRLMGALLVIAAMTAAMVVPVGGGLRIAGNATTIELPGAPTVGDCMLETTTEFVQAAVHARSRTAPSPTVPATPNLLAPTFGSCQGQLAAGEVVALVSATGDPRARRAWAEGSGLDCRTAALLYAGLVPAAGRFVIPDQPIGPVAWNLSVNLRATWVLPSRILQDSGRTWVACIVAPMNAGKYQGRIAGAYQGGRLPDELGTCWDQPRVGAGINPVDCGRPHRAELISAGIITDVASTTTAQVLEACRQLAARSVGTSDPTFGGALAVTISPGDITHLPDHGSEPSILCFISAPDGPSLNGTLIGVGDGPLPYTG